MRRLGVLPTAGLILAADLGGTVVFAIEGALAAIAGSLDLLGVLVLAFVTAVGGGILRDVLIGAAPPSAFRDTRYPMTALGAGAATFLFHTRLGALPDGLLTQLDAAGLALFAVAGTEKALAFNIRPALAPLMGTLAAVGGGVMRDVLLAHVPAVLRVDIYATAALAGSAIVVVCHRLGVPGTVAAVIGALVCFGLRLVSVSRHWHLPTAGEV